MRNKKIALLSAAVGLACLSAVPASAANIVLRYDDSFSNSPNGAAALFAFQKAANYWNQTLTNDTSLLFDVHFGPLGANILGGTYSNVIDTSTASVYAGLAATGTTALDSIAVANLRPLSAAGGLGMRVPAPRTAVGELGLDTTPGSVYDNDDSYNNRNLSTNTSINKAIGLGVNYSNALFASPDAAAIGLRADADADITFSSNFAFDFDPTNGIDIGKYDFVAVAVHEMGHALGFVSGVDDYDYYAFPNGPGAAAFATQNQDNYAWGSSWDLFRYAATGAFDPATGDRYLQWDPGRNAFFSLDGVNPFNFNNQSEAEFANLSTGRYNGDGQQASHWKDAAAIFDQNGCAITDRQIGIMDPTAQSCSLGIVTSNDLAAFDAMGWNLGINILANRDYTFDTAQIFRLNGLAEAQPVPEPASWAMMIGGFGLIGGSMRRYRPGKTAVAHGRSRLIDEA